jgi:aminoglycoside phosphotransferase (APT) family kinase protein
MFSTLDPMNSTVIDEGAQARDDALLADLRGLLDAPEIEWAATPRPVGDGAESVVLEIELREAGEWSGRPLVVRLLQIDDFGQLAREAAIQSALADRGFAAPVPVAVGPGRPGILKPFLVMERVPGRAMFSLLPWLFAVGFALTWAKLGALAIALGIGWYALAVWLQHKLHVLPVSAIERSIAERGIDPADFGVDGCLDRLDARLARLDLKAFEPGLAWLRSNPPAARAAVVCHGDYWAGNVMISPLGRVSLIDWGNAAIAPPEFDLGWNLVQDCGDLSPADRDRESMVGRLFAAVHVAVRLVLLPHRWLYRVFGRLDSEALDYYTAFHCMRILIWSYEREAADGSQNPWSSRRARTAVASRFANITRVELEMPESSSEDRRLRLGSSS